MIVNARQMVDARKHNVKEVVDEIQASIESDHQGSSTYHQVPLPAQKERDRFPVRWVAGGIVILLVLAVLLSLAIMNVVNPPATATISAAPTDVATTAPTLESIAPIDLNQPVTIELLNAWRASEGSEALVENELLQQVAMDHVSYLRSLPLSELEQTNLFRNVDGQDAQFMAQEAGYSGTVEMRVIVTEDTATLADVVGDIENPAQFREVGFREVRAFATGYQYFVMILGAPA
jgi:hypothetical protein